MSGYYKHQRRMLHEVTLDLVAVAMGHQAADLIIHNAATAIIKCGT